jgi:predicted ATPase/DNA-binding winged helix-turn-helix (wHTH) protein
LSQCLNRLRFGRFELRPVERQLTIDGQPAEVGGRALDLLLALVERRDRVVTKNELLDLVWPGLVVEEGNIKVQVSTLRKLLGPQALATVPGRGYRFALPLDDDAAAPVAAAGFASLPNPASTLLGRDNDIAALQLLLQQHRLVSVLGAGGIGKTALALAAAHVTQEFHADGAAWVELTQVGDPAEVPAALSQALRVPLRSVDPMPGLIAALAPLKLLLVIDNAEHVAEAVARLVQAIIANTRHVTVFVTSQAALKLPQERVYRLGPLDIPDTPLSAADALAYGAVALFAERAQAVDRHFSVTDANVGQVIHICRGLDGLALAIELAAARLPLLGLQGLAQRLDERLRLLGGGVRAAPSRQQTLLAALDWSHGLLSSAEQTVFRRLGVFVGGFSVDTASAVACDDSLDEWAVIDTLGALVDRSLVAVDAAEPPRYRLLESAREYALLQLGATGELEAMRRRHAQALLTLAERADDSLWATREAQWLAARAVELDNIRAALAWSTQHDPALALALAGASGYLFECLGLQYEARTRCTPLELALPGVDVAAEVAARFHLIRGRQMRDVSAAMHHEFAMKAVALYRELGDTRRLYESLYSVVSGFLAFGAEAVAAMHEMALLEQPDWPPGLRALGKVAVSNIDYAQGRHDENGAVLDAALRLAVEAGADRLTIIILTNLADHALSVGHIDDAVERGRQLTDLLRRERKTSHLAFALANLANALLQQGASAQARQALTEALGVMRAQDWHWLRGFGDVYALLAASEGRVEAAARLIGWADDVRKARGERHVAEARSRELAHAAAASTLDAATLERLSAEGAKLGPAAVCELTLATG